MKNNYKKTILLSLSIFLSGCALHSGTMSSSASLSSANFTYTKMNAKGTSGVSYLFGIGGLERTNLVNAAKQDLLKTTPLESNQALVNVTVNFKKEFYLLIYCQVTCIVAGDIVTFTK